LSSSFWDHKFELKPACWVFVPTEESKQHGYNLKQKIESKWRAPHYYFHLKSGGHVEALKKHLGNKYFAQADIKNFFNSISRSRVTRALNSLFKDYDLARSSACSSVVADPDSTEGEFILPFGFVQSPIIASLCLYQSALGRYLDRLVSTGFRVSVYIHGRYNYIYITITRYRKTGI
jgi:hypothetical protein